VRFAGNSAGSRANCSMRLVEVVADVETIQAIAGLWKLVLALAIIIALGLAATLFRKQVRAFFDRLSRFRVNWGNKELSVNHDALPSRPPRVTRCCKDGAGDSR